MSRRWFVIRAKTNRETSARMQYERQVFSDLPPRLSSGKKRVFRSGIDAHAHTRYLHNQTPETALLPSCRPC